MRLKSRMLGCLSALALCVGLALMMAAPGSALATTCITGSGSSLQLEQQNMWTEAGGFTLTGCPRAVRYLVSSSGKGLAEWGVGSSKITLTESPSGQLDGYVGTDDPPTSAQLTEMEKAGGTGSGPLAVAVVAAPVALLVHLPLGCVADHGEEKHLFLISLTTLDKAWSELGYTWEHFILDAKLTPLEETTNACQSEVLREVRSDSSGTSFAFKQFLCQIDPTVWGGGATSKCESGEGFVTDAVTWPSSSMVDTEHLFKGVKEPNNKGKGEAEAVLDTEGSIGYANLADAAKDGFLPYLLAHEGALLSFWVQLEGEEPVKNGNEGNCPTSFTFVGAQEKEAKEGIWSTVHLANKNQTGAYALCTFTYDIGWMNYKTTELEKATNYNGKGQEVGETAEKYFEYMTKNPAGKEGQKLIEAYYSKLPSNVQTIAEELAKKHINK